VKLSKALVLGLVVYFSVLTAGFAQSPPPTAKTKGRLLGDMTWMEARDALSADTVIVIALGAESKEHGPHLKLRNDWTMAEYFKRRILEASDVVVAPTINYHFYPAFVEYPGSTTLRLETARDLVVDICASLAKHGPRRFYIINTGVSTLRALAPSAELLAQQGILLRYTDILNVSSGVAKSLTQQKEGTHADEIETSKMLFIDPQSVDMRKASRDYPTGQGVLTPDKNKPGRYSPSGIYGDATFATREKGEKVVEATLQGMLREIDQLRHATLP
jgi:creatinine amidohydrolase